MTDYITFIAEFYADLSVRSVFKNKKASLGHKFMRSIHKTCEAAARKENKHFKDQYINRFLSYVLVQKRLGVIWDHTRDAAAKFVRVISTVLSSP